MTRARLGSLCLVLPGRAIFVPVGILLEKFPAMTAAIVPENPAGWTMRLVKHSSY